MLQADPSPSTTGASSVVTSGVLTSSTSSSATTSTESVAPRKSSSSKQTTKQVWPRGLFEDSGAHKQTRLELIVSAIKERKNEIPGSNSYVGYYGNKVVSMVGWGLNVPSLRNAAGTPLDEYIASINPYDWSQETRIDEKDSITAYSWMVSYAMSTLRDINELEKTTAEEIDDLKRSTTAKVADLERVRDEKVSQLQADKNTVVAELARKLAADESEKNKAKRSELERLETEKNEGVRELQDQSAALLRVHGKSIEVLEKSTKDALRSTAQAVRANEVAIEGLKKEKEAQKASVKEKFKAELAALQTKGGADIEAAQVKADQAIEETKAKAAKDIADARLHEKTTIEAKTLHQTNEVRAGFATINSCMGYLDTIMKNMQKEDIAPNHEVTNELFKWIVEATDARKDGYAEQLKRKAIVLQETMIECGVEQDNTAARKLARIVSKSKPSESKSGTFSSTSPTSTTTTTTSTTKSDPAPIELASNVVTLVSPSPSIAVATGNPSSGSEVPLVSPPLSITIATGDVSSGSEVPLPSTTAMDSLAPYSDTVLSHASRQDQLDEALREGEAKPTVVVQLSETQSSALAFGGVEVASVNNSDPAPRASDTTLSVVTSSNEAGSQAATLPSPVLPRSNSDNTLGAHVATATKENEASSLPSVSEPVLLVGPASSAEVMANEVRLSPKIQPIPSSPSDDEPLNLSSSMTMSLESSPSQPSDEPIIPEPNHSREASPSREDDNDGMPTVAANDDKKPSAIILAPQRRTAVIPAPKDATVTVHVASGETKQDGKVSADQAKLARMQSSAQFKHAANSKEHSNMGVLIKEKYDPSLMKNGKYPIETALIHLSSTSLSTPALYEYMMYSIQGIKERECERQISVESLKTIVADHRSYDPTLKQNWVKYVENKGKLPEVGLAA